MLNRLSSSLLVVSFLGAFVPPATPAERSSSPFKGDVDGDHRLDANDLLRLRRALDGVAPLSPGAAFRADVDGDGIVTEIDFSMLTFPALDATSIPPFGEVAAGTPVVHDVSPPFAPPGATVVLGGEGFGRGPFANEVRVGDVVADVVSATAERIEFTVPDETGVVSVRNLESGLRGLSASFVVAASPEKEFDPSLPEGSVLLTTPDVVPQANDVFLVPLALATGGAVPSVFHVRIAFDPEHVEAICLEPLQPEWFTPLPPCIDNAAGVLGAGALRVAVSAAPPPGDPMPIFAIGFEVKTYRPHPPKLVVRVEAISGGPGDAPVGEKTPRFAVDTVQLHPAPSTPPGAREWLGNVADLPVLTSVSSSVGSSKTVLTVTGSGLPSGNGAGGCLAVLGDAVLVPSAKTPTSFQLTLSKAVASGPLVLVDLPTAGVSSDVL
ncbi:MAG: dockerin type I domain-containing protein, partial [Planctomycetota bacterium JB042]